MDVSHESHRNISITHSLESPLPWSPRNLRHLSLVVALISPRLVAFKNRMTAYQATLKRQLGLNSILAFIIHKSTVLVIFAAFTLLGGAFAFLSTIQSQQQASSFSVAISQSSFSLLSVYLTVLPILRSRSLHLRYPFWFWGCLVLSSLTSILSTAIYFRSAAVATIISCISGFTQVICSLLLVECVEEAVKAGHIGDG